MIEFSVRIDRSILMVQEICAPEELKPIGWPERKLLGEILLEVMNPLYAEHPDLTPAGLD